MRYVSAPDLPNSIDRAGKLTRNHKKQFPHGLGHEEPFRFSPRTAAFALGSSIAYSKTAIICGPSAPRSPRSSFGPAWLVPAGLDCFQSSEKWQTARECAACGPGDQVASNTSAVDEIVHRTYGRAVVMENGPIPAGTVAGLRAVSVPSAPMAYCEIVLSSKFAT
jgi:hypothetical protein